MNALQRWQRIETMFQAAWDLPASDRHAYLDSACGDDPVLRSEVESLIEEAEASEDFLDEPVLVTAERTRLAQHLPSGTCIDDFTICGVLGEGGMAVVYRAEQEKPRREVALKVLRPGAVSPAAMRRFSNESELLAKLQHPGIASIHAVGVAQTEWGDLPYFALERVHGDPLCNYANQHALDLRQRVQLLLEICAAVAHAHQNNIVHRDLKPANILVSASDGGHRARVLDFGVAREIDIDAQGADQTRAGQVIGTLAYMSPEQARGETDLDQRSDVYTLGLVAYELLTGHRPYDLQDLPLMAAVRVINEQAPRSAAIVRDELRGDLGTILEKALRKQPAQRYQDAAALAADLQRFQQRRPIAARPPSLSYHARQFARRHIGLTIGLTVGLVSLLAGTTFAVWQAIEAHRGRERAVRAEQQASERRVVAERAQARAEAVVQFLTEDLLAAASPAALGRDATIREALDDASDTAAERFGDDPKTELAVRITLGRTYFGLGAMEAAQRELQIAEQLATELEAATLQIEVHDWLARTLGARGQLAEADALRAANLQAARAHYGAAHPVTLTQHTNLAHSHQRAGRLDEAEAAYREILTHYGDTDAVLDGYLATVGNLAALHAQQGHFDQAAVLLRDSVARCVAARGAEHPGTLIQRANLAFVLTRLGAFVEAEGMLQELIGVRTRVLGAAHPDTLNTMHNLGGLYLRSERHAEARRTFEQLLALRIAHQGPHHPHTLSTRSNLGVLLLRQERPEEAEPHLREAVAGTRAAFPEESLELARIKGNLGRCLLALGQYPESFEHLSGAQRIFQRLAGDAHPDTVANAATLAELESIWQPPDEEGE